MRTAFLTLPLVALVGVATATAQQAKPDTTKPKHTVTAPTAKPTVPPTAAKPSTSKTKKHKKTKPDSTKKNPAN